MYIDLLMSKAVDKGLLKSEEKIDPECAFLLVRDMPYTRASSRDPETIIREWRGTCSGKHYLLKQLFAELGYSSRLIACTTVAQIDPLEVRGKLRAYSSNPMVALSMCTTTCSLIYRKAK